MQPKWFLIPLFLYLLFLVGMCFIGLGKFASIAFADGWWVFTKDVASLLSSAAAVFGLPWAIWLYFKQWEKERIDKWHEQARWLLDDLLKVLSEEKLIRNQLTINSLLYRLRSYIGEFDKHSNSDYLFALRTHLNQLFIHLGKDSLFESPDRTSVWVQTINVYSTDIPDLTGEFRQITISLAISMVNAKCYSIHEIADLSIVTIDKGFDPKLLSKLVLISQPICIGNFTHRAADVLWRQENLKDIFGVLPPLLAAYIYLSYSECGHDLIRRLDKDIHNKTD